MLAETSPFTPGIPVPFEYFVGRRTEIERLREMVRAVKSGRPKIGLVAGERGIGKSSLVAFVRRLSERDDGAAAAHVFLGGVTELPEMVRRVFDRLLKESAEKSWHQKIRDYFGKHVKEVGLFGISVELDIPPGQLGNLVHDFVPSLRRLMSQIRDERAILLLVLDDINGLAESKAFAHWLKSLMDEIATSEQGLPLCLLLVGLEDRRESLIRQQPSLGRYFEVIDINPWEIEETKEFYNKAFASAKVSVSEDALRVMSEFAGGLPVMAHEIGDAVWRLAVPPTATLETALLGVFAAAEQIGRKMFEPQVMQEVRSERYRTILRTVGEKVFGERPILGPDIHRFKRSEIRAFLGEDEADVLDNFLRRMVNLGVLRRDPEGGRGGYSFTNRLHLVYFFIEAQRAKKEAGKRGR